MQIMMVGPSKIATMNIPKEIQVGRWGIPPKSDAFHASSDATLFSSSLPVLPHAKCMCPSTLPLVGMFSKSLKKG